MMNYKLTSSDTHNTHSGVEQSRKIYTHSVATYIIIMMQYSCFVATS